MIDRLYVLVDYDNLAGFRTARTLDVVIRHIESRIPDAFLEGISRIEIRLYGGWFIGQSLTRQAQSLGAEMQSYFPATIQRQNALGAIETRILTVTFARSGLFLPSVALSETFMPGRSVGNIQINQSGWRACASPGNCSLTAVESFLRNDRCSSGDCGVTTRDLLRRNEQKQVDTLLVADMAELTLRQAVKRVAIVSSDMDMLPGVLLCLTAGAAVCHMHTSAGALTKPVHMPGLARAGGTYQQTSV
jgi:uncharacterized LabA/DUF88 family protein